MTGLLGMIAKALGTHAAPECHYHWTDFSLDLETAEVYRVSVTWNPEEFFQIFFMKIKLS